MTNQSATMISNETIEKYDSLLFETFNEVCPDLVWTESPKFSRLFRAMNILGSGNIDNEREAYCELFEGANHVEIILLWSLHYNFELTVKQQHNLLWHMQDHDGLTVKVVEAATNPMGFFAKPGSPAVLKISSLIEEIGQANNDRFVCKYTKYDSNHRRPSGA